MERGKRRTNEVLQATAGNILLLGTLAGLAAHMSLHSGKENSDEMPEPPESNGQASEKGGPQGDLKKPYEPKGDPSKN